MTFLDTKIDCMIAAVCLRAGAGIATNNVADFQRFASLGLLVVAP
jgi:predicted nucleic acid-binding protein